MRKVFSFFKILLPLLFGGFLIWYVFKDLTENEKSELYFAFDEANYFWIWVSVIFGILSHASRAIRWKYTIQPLGKTPSFLNSFFTVMIGYVANLALPRLGEVTRPGLLAKYEGLPFNKLFGTIVAERVADLLILGLIIITTIFLELEVLKEKLSYFYTFGLEKYNFYSILLIIIFIIILAIGGLIVLFKSQNSFIIKIRGLVRGVFEGVQSILKMENKGPFLLHTAFIWIMYILMFYACFYSIDETAGASLSAVLASFVMGSLSIVFVQGGLGVFPIAIMETLILYGIPKGSALALGWILWSSQTIMIIVLGVLSLLLIRLVNKNSTIEPVK